MATADRLRLRDVRAAYRLVGECRDLGNDAHAWRKHLLEGLSALTDSQLALYLEVRNATTEAEQLAEPMAVGLLDRSQSELWAHYQRENAQRDDLFHQRYYGDFPGALKTRQLGSVVDRREWRASRHYNEYVRACGLRDRITSSVKLTGYAEPTIQTIVLHRAAADGDYSRRTVRLVRLFHHEISTLLDTKLALPSRRSARDALSPQLARVLDGLLSGLSEKEIARQLALSPSTVNRHVQRLYRRFDVHSRAKLMALWQRHGAEGPRDESAR